MCLACGKAVCVYISVLRCVEKPPRDEGLGALAVGNVAEVVSLLAGVSCGSVNVSYVVGHRGQASA